MASGLPSPPLPPPHQVDGDRHRREMSLLLLSCVMFAQSMTAPCQRSQKGRTLAATVRVHDELRAAISDRRNRRVARGPARLCRRRCMEKGDEVVNPFLVFKLPRRSPSASQEEGRDESSPQNPRGNNLLRRRPGPQIWCALSRNEAESQQRKREDRGICPGIFGLRHFVIGCDQEVPEKLPCPFPSPLSTA